MYKIYFYRDRNGRQPVLDYLRELKKQNSKDARIKLNKLNDYIEAQKTPRREIQKAMRELADLIERSESDE